MNQALIKLAKKYLVSKLLLISVVTFSLAFLLNFYEPLQKPLDQTVVPTTNQANPDETLKVSQKGVTTISTKPNKKAGVLAKSNPQINPSATPAPSSIPESDPIQVTTTPSSQPSSNLSPQPENQVNIQISEPDGNFSFSVTLQSGDDLCSSLSRAKDEGKIRSLNVDDSYMSTFGSSYVREINGYQNNWTVSVNGESPKGCSLYKPNPGDNISWKFN